jgi:integrase-like protein
VVDRYHRTSDKRRKLYCATVMDAYSRLIIGWSIADHMRTELVIDALARGCTSSAPRNRFDDPALWPRNSIRLLGVRATTTCHRIAPINLGYSRQMFDHGFLEVSERGRVSLAWDNAD